MTAKKVYEIDGQDFETLDGFYDAISTKLIPGAYWGRNLDAFNDILRGGFGTPPEGFVLRWKNSKLSAERLGYAETVRHLELRLKRCHPENRSRVLEDLRRAQARQGPTVFDWLVEIIQIHVAGGPEEEDGVTFELC